MDRVSMCNRIGNEYKTSNIEGGEYSYVQAAGSKEKLIQAIGYEPEHFKLDIRFEHNGVVILVETKQVFTDADEKQLREYLLEERMVHFSKKIVCILANTNDDRIKVWKSEMDGDHLLKDETVLDTMMHYVGLFEVNRQNNREAVLKNTYALNETLHRKDIDEKLRSQFVGTILLYIRDVIRQKGISRIDDQSLKLLREYWNGLSAPQIRSGIKETLDNLLDDSDNKTLKIELLQRNVLNNQKVKRLKVIDWVDVLIEIVENIYKYINTDSAEGQDILNLFFIAFNKYAGKKDPNQAFTPDHITNFMCRVAGVDHTTRVFDGTCGSGSFLVQAMVLALANVNKQKATEEEKKKLREAVAKEHIYGIENEENAFGLATTNMLIHGDGNSNIKFIDNLGIFDKQGERFIREANPDIILMNPPYNAKPIGIPAEYKKDWKADAKTDPTKGLVFLQYVADVIKKMNEERAARGEKAKLVKCAILLPPATAIGGGNKQIVSLKHILLENNRLDAVFSLPKNVFHPGSSSDACCMVFTLGKPHVNPDDTVDKTFFGYYKEDGHKKKKNLGRIEQFDRDNNSIWKQIEETWLDFYRNKTVKDGMSAMQAVSGDDEWLCEAYMKTDYSKLSESDFQNAINDYCGYLVKIGKYPRLIAKTSHVPNLNVQKWEEFSVTSLFSHIESGKVSNAGELEDGIDCPYLGAKKDNNGVMQMCTDIPSMRSKGNCVVLICDGEGSVGLANYMESDFLGTVNLTLGYNDEHLNPYTGLFLATVLSQERPKYSYGRKWKTHIPETVVKLPADSNGHPDWRFMENYIKSLPYGDRLEG